MALGCSTNDEGAAPGPEVSTMMVMAWTMIMLSHTPRQHNDWRSSVLRQRSCWMELRLSTGCRWDSSWVVGGQPCFAELAVVTWLLLSYRCWLVVDDCLLLTGCLWAVCCWLPVLSCCCWLVVSELSVVDWLSLSCLLLIGRLWAACCWLVVSGLPAVVKLAAVDWLSLSWLLLSDCCQAGCCWLTVVSWLLLSCLLSPDTDDLSVVNWCWNACQQMLLSCLLSTDAVSCLLSTDFAVFVSWLDVAELFVVNWLLLSCLLSTDCYKVACC